MKNRAWIACIIMAIASCKADGAFVNNVEDFNGTTVDSIAWSHYFWGNGAATVSNGYLDLTGQYELIANMITLGVGDTLSARAMLTAPSSSGTVLEMGLTSDPSQPQGGEYVEMYLVNSIQGDSFFAMDAGGNGVSTGLGTVATTNNVGTWYRIQLQRNSLSQYTSEILSDSGVLLYRIDATRTGLPDRASLYIGIGPTARFDWVAVPEPATTALLGAAFLLMLCRRTVRSIDGVAARR